MTDFPRPKANATFAPGDVDAALEALEAERRKLRSFQEQMTELTTVVHSPDRMLSMTFTGQGELSKLTFNTTKYRTMAPKELAHVIVTTLAAGRAEAMGKLGDIMGPGALPGTSFSELASGKADLSAVLDNLLSPALQWIADEGHGQPDRRG